MVEMTAVLKVASMAELTVVLKVASMTVAKVDSMVDPKVGESVACWVALKVEMLA